MSCVFVDVGQREKIEAAVEGVKEFDVGVTVIVVLIFFDGREVDGVDEVQMIEEDVVVNLCTADYVGHVSGFKCLVDSTFKRTNKENVLFLGEDVWVLSGGDIELSSLETWETFVSFATDDEVTSHGFLSEDL